MTAISRLRDDQVMEGIASLDQQLKDLERRITALEEGEIKKLAESVDEGFAVVLAEMAKWHAALEALHADVRQIKRCIENGQASGGS